jgi:tetratricopeptide (TPR) repeat protein
VESWNGEFHRQLGIIWLRLGQLEQALKCTKEGVEKSPNSAFAWHCYADVLSSGKQDHLALDAARKAADLEPSNSYHHFFLGRLLFKIGDSNALKHLETALILDPRNHVFKALADEIRTWGFAGALC